MIAKPSSTPFHHASNSAAHTCGGGGGGESGGCGGCGSVRHDATGADGGAGSQHHGADSLAASGSGVGGADKNCTVCSYIGRCPVDKPMTQDEFEMAVKVGGTGGGLGWRTLEKWLWGDAKESSFVCFVSHPLVSSFFGAL